MALLVDATTAEHATGIGTVIRALLAELPEVAGPSTMVSAGPTLEANDRLQVRRVQIARTRVGRLLYQRLLLPFDASPLGGGQQVDRILTLDSYAPVFTGPSHLRYGALVHDVLPLTDPEFWSRSQRITKRLAFASIRRAGAATFTSTEYTAGEIKRVLGIAPRVVRFGCGQLSDAEADAAHAEQLAEREPYLLYVGAIEPRKGTLSLIGIFDSVVARGDNDLQLVIVGGGPTPYVRQVEARIAASPNRARIRVVKRASRRETVALVRSATALVFPTLAEGFGLPVLEALALGTPVVASRIEPITSWAGAAVLYSPPTDIRGWVDRIEEASGFDDGRRRSGQDLAAGYRWRSCASQLVSF
jgi:glycosyltransferase involved in cell wall biosynthesis